MFRLLPQGFFRLLRPLGKYRHNLSLFGLLDGAVMRRLGEGGDWCCICVMFLASPLNLEQFKPLPEKRPTNLKSQKGLKDRDIAPDFDVLLLADNGVRTKKALVIL